MKNPYLIQRGKFQNREDKKGIDSLLSFDYMGSSEFEYGALPSSLRRVRENLSKYVQFHYSLKKYPNKFITVFCRIEQEDFIGDILEKLASREIRLKEFSAFDSYIKDDGYFKDKFDFWWDIDQDWFFWKSNPEFDIKFREKLNN